MTQLASATSSHKDLDKVSRALPGLGAAVFVVSSIWTALGAHTVTEIVVCVAIGLVAAVGLYGFVLPRTLHSESPGGLALGLSLTAALLTLPAFWTGLPLVLGAAGVVLGHVGRHRSSGSGKSIAAVVIGALVVIGYLSIYIVDGLVFGNL